VSLPARPLKVLFPVLPINVLAEALPDPPMFAVPIKIRFSTFLERL
jgi:hypothetical protein